MLPEFFAQITTSISSHTGATPAQNEWGGTNESFVGRPNQGIGQAYRAKLLASGGKVEPKSEVFGGWNLWKTHGQLGEFRNFSSK